MNKRQLKNHLVYYWWVYLLISAAVVVIWQFAFEQRLKVDKDRIFSVAVFAENCDENYLKEELQLVFKNGGSKIEQVNTFIGNTDDNYDKSQLLWARSLDCDIILIAESKMSENIGDVYFAEIDDSDSDLTYYKEDGKAYAIKIDQNNSHLKKIFSHAPEHEQIYLFITVSGANRTEETDRIIDLFK